jgi:hypothetical protein
MFNISHFSEGINCRKHEYMWIFLVM